MPDWRFKILDRNAVATVIDEPVGWDGNTSEIKRHPDWHGIFFTNQGDTFSFYGPARKLLKDEYELYASEGDMVLIMEEDCGNGYEEFSRGRFDFLKYYHSCGDECFVKIPVEKYGEILELTNRINQKVNLESVKAFDEVTDLPAYNKLPFDLIIPSKGIVLKNDAENEAINATPVGGDVDKILGVIEIGMDKTVSGEIGGFSFEAQPKYTMSDLVSSDPQVYVVELVPGDVFTYIVPDYYSPTVNFAKEFANVNDIGSADIETSFLISGKIKAVNADLNDISLLFIKRSASDVYTELVKEIIHADRFVHLTKGNEVSFSKAYIATLNLTEGDRLYLLMTVDLSTVGLPHSFIDNAFEITFDVGNYFRMEALSHTAPTISKVFMINEVISRITEGITNNKLKAISNYFGRTDSQPYNQPFDGCGALEVVTDGLRIRRQENKVPGKTNVFSLSIDDIFEGLNPIHNIGMGIEKDTNRPGFNRLRVEPWSFFYQRVVVMRCIDVNKIERKAFEKEIYSTFQFGYNKWEAEEYNGLDEFLTKRIYRTTLGQVKNDLVKLSKFISSGYAEEVTRRKGTDSKDWRYDKETFIICCIRGGLSISAITTFTAVGGSFYIITNNPAVLNFFTVGTAYTISNTAFNNGNFIVTAIDNFSGTVQVHVSGIALIDETIQATFTDNTPNQISVERGNVTNPENIIDPDTILNWRIRPLYNAMRWMNRVLESYRQFDANAKLIFTDGDANYFAKGEMTDPHCKIEAAAVAENDTINLTIYKDSDDAKPFLLPERVIYEYPMTSKEYKLLELIPYGLIYFENDCERGYGFIDDIKYTPEAGLATFNLIPAIVDASTLRRTIITQDGFDIDNEDGKYWEPE
ncbi:MAG: hypothetical protein JWO92_2549 [Chitinophagaceae bacterium]|nr:hypothetical protein [Chitinophagaceae bacterium]